MLTILECHVLYVGSVMPCIEARTCRHKILRACRLTGDAPWAGNQCSHYSKGDGAQPAIAAYLVPVGATLEKPSKVCLTSVSAQIETPP